MVTSPGLRAPCIELSARAHMRVHLPQQLSRARNSLGMGPEVLSAQLPTLTWGGPLLLHAHLGTGVRPQLRVPWDVHVVGGGQSCPGGLPSPAVWWVSWPSSPSPPSTHRPQARPGFRSCRHLGRPHYTWFQSAACLDEWCLVRARRGSPPTGRAR